MVESRHIYMGVINSMQILYCACEMADRFQGQMHAHPAQERSLTLFKVTTQKKAAPTKLPKQQQRCTAGNRQPVCKQATLPEVTTAFQPGLNSINILASFHPRHVFSDLFLIKVSPGSVFHIRMITETTDKNPLITKNIVVSNALPDSTLEKVCACGEKEVRE